MPACSRRIAAVCRRVWGVTVFWCREGQLRGVGCVLGESACERVAGECVAGACGEERVGRGCRRARRARCGVQRWSLW